MPEIVPVEHAAVPVGAAVTLVLFAEPQAPGVEAMPAEHCVDVVPPLKPAQFHVKL